MTLVLRRKVTYKSLQDNRKFFYVAVLFISACLTESPNYPGQLLLAIPSIILFEFIIFLMAKYKIVVFTNWQE
jgi:Sec-independent protein secretion pathway component TatC